MLSIESLPPEMLASVLSHLNINDLLKCRLVNRLWRATVENNIKIGGLVIEPKSQERVRWIPEIPAGARFAFFHHLAEEPNHRFATDSNRFLESRLMRSMLKNLKQLSIHRVDSSLARALAQLTNLRYLQVSGYFEMNKPNTLRMASLQILSVERTSSTLKLDTHQLSSFRTRSPLAQFEFVHPESVICFSSDKYEPAIQQFVNLSICYIGMTSTSEYYVDPQIPSDLRKFPPNVQEIHLGEPCTKSLISGLLTSKKKLRRSDLKLFYCGLPVDTIEEVTQYLAREDSEDSDRYLLDFNHGENFDLVLDAYSKLAPFLPFLTSVNYSDLLRFFDGRIENGFFSKFVNIQKLTVAGPINDKQQFVSFLQRCKRLFVLKLKNAGLDQSAFYDRLPIFAPYLQKITIDEAQELDWSFALKLKYLDTFKVTQTVTFSLLLKLMRQCVRLGWIQLKFNGKLLNVSCSENLETEIESSGKTARFESKQKLIKFIKKCQIFDN